MKEKSTLLEELQRRNILKLVTAYAVAGFVVLQLCDILFPAMGIEDAAIAYVLAVLAIGLPIVVIFGWMFELTPGGLKRTQEVDNNQSITRSTGQRINQVIIVLLSLAVIFFAYEYFVPASDENSGPSVATETDSTTPPATPIAAAAKQNIDARPSIAVLPFVNMSSDIENEYFSDGLSEEVLNLLAQTRGLRVAGRTSSFFYKGKNENLTLIGNALNVDHLLEGSVRKSGNTVRITAQLISAIDGFHLWSKTYDRELKDIFAVQDEIAGEVTRALQVTLLTDGVMVSDRSTTTPEAYDLFLRAKNALYSRDINSIRLAIKLFQETIALDPEYAPAYLEYAMAEIILSNNFRAGRMEDALLKAKAAIDSAAQLDHLNDDYYAALGLYYYHAHIFGASTYKDSIAALKKSLELNPNNVRPYLWLAGNNTARSIEPDRLLVSKRYLEKALEIDPLNRVANGNYTGLIDTLGETEKSIELLKHLVKTDPDYPTYASNLAFIYLQNGKFELAAEWIAKTSDDNSNRGFALYQLLRTFNEREQFLHFIDHDSLDSTAYDAWQMVETTLTATTGELKAEAEIFLMRPDPDYRVIPLIFEMAFRHEYAVVVQLIENYAPRYLSEDFYEERTDSQDLNSTYVIALHAEGQTRKAQRMATHLLSQSKDLRFLGIGSKGESNILHYQILGQSELALQEFSDAVDAGWLGYYESVTLSAPLFDDLRDDPRWVATKLRIDNQLAHRKPGVMKVLVDAGLISQQSD